MLKETQIPDGLFQKCIRCNEIIYTGDLIDNTILVLTVIIILE